METIGKKKGKRGEEKNIWEVYEKQINSALDQLESTHLHLILAQINQSLNQSTQVILSSAQIDQLTHIHLSDYLSSDDYTYTIWIWILTLSQTTTSITAIWNSINYNPINQPNNHKQVIFNIYLPNKTPAWNKTHNMF